MSQRPVDGTSEEPDQPGPKRSADDRTQQDAGLDGGGAARGEDERVGTDEDANGDEDAGKDG